MRPGRRHISLRWSHDRSYASATLWFDAEPGVTYLVRQRVKDRGVLLWIEDTRTGKPVGGIVESEP